MHKIHITNGIVLGKRGVGEANTLAVFLTQELGLVQARAQSARAEKSKLRYGLEPLSLGRFSFVKGKHEWRLTGAVNISRGFVSASVIRRGAMGRVSRLLLRLIHGQEPVPEIYASIVNGFDFIANAEHDIEAQSAECVLVLRVLSHLGYLPRHPELTPFVEAPLFSLELAAMAKESRPLLIRAINKSLEATGL